MKYAILASGSKGNCCVLISQDTQIVIDCGMTQKYLKAGFQTIGVDIMGVDALLITHDHSDHSKQVKLFKDRKIYSPSPLDYEATLITPYQAFMINHVLVTPIVTSHDAEHSVGYVFEDGISKLVYVTDTGYIRDQDLEIIKHADHYILESNHDPELLMRTARPYYIKQRILSDTGHLSNDEAGRILSKVISEKTQSITLAHMSLEANTVDLAISTIRRHIRKDHITLKVAKQFEIVHGGAIE